MVLKRITYFTISTTTSIVHLQWIWVAFFSVINLKRDIGTTLCSIAWKILITQSSCWAHSSYFSMSTM